MNRRDFLQLALAASAATVLPGCVSAQSPVSVPAHAKRGLGIGTRRDTHWQEKIEKCGACWFYNWTTTPPENIPLGVEFFPMVWKKVRQESFPQIQANLRENKLKTLLGYNEPDQKKQGNLTVEEALEQWPKLMELGVRLGSPAGVHPDGEWMKGFMKGVAERRLRVDFVTVHSYGGPNADALMKHLATVHELFGLPLWITEFGVGDWKAKTREENIYRPAQIVDFLHKLLPQLDASKFIERYAWFSAKPESAALGPCALFDADGTLTPVGEAYRTS